MHGIGQFTARVIEAAGGGIIVMISHLALGEGKWLYYGIQAAFDRFAFSSAIASQAASSHRKLEMGAGIYFTDSLERAVGYAPGDKGLSYVYHVWAPQSLLNLLEQVGKVSYISGTQTLQYVVDSPEGVDLLNQTIQRASAVDAWFDQGWKDLTNP